MVIYLLYWISFLCSIGIFTDCSVITSTLLFVYLKDMVIDFCHISTVAVSCLDCLQLMQEHLRSYMCTGRPSVGVSTLMSTLAAVISLFLFLLWFIYIFVCIFAIVY